MTSRYLRSLYALASLTLCLSSHTTNAQTSIYLLDFESDTGYSVSPAACTDGSGNYVTRTDGSDIGSTFSNIQGTFFFAAQDTDHAPCTSRTYTLTITDIDVSGYADLHLAGFFAEDDDGDNQDWDANTSVQLAVAIDGGDFTTVLAIEAEGGTNTAPRIDTDFDGTGDGAEITDAFTRHTATIPGTGRTLDLQITLANLDAGDEDIAFDNLEILGTSADNPTEVNFIAATAATAEQDVDAVYEIAVTITNPSQTIDTMVDVDAQTGGTASGSDYAFTSTTLTFPAGQSGNQVATVTIRGDDVPEGAETLWFGLSRVSGGTRAVLGPIDAFVLTIEDDDLPDIVINEVLADPDAATGDANGDGTVSTSDDEFIELVNAGPDALDLSGYTLADAVGERHVFPAGTLVPPGGAMTVFGGGVPTGIAGFAQVASSGGLGLNNGGDTVRLFTPVGAEAGVVTYGSEGGQNQSITRDPDLAGAFVGHRSAAGSSDDFSPGRRTTHTPFTPSPVIVLDGPAGGGAGWRMLSAPMQDFTVSMLMDDYADLSIAEGAGDPATTFYYYDPSTASFETPTTADTPLSDGLGWILYVFGDADFPLLLDMPESASYAATDITVPLNPAPGGFSLVGNPFYYNLALDSNLITAEGSGIQAVVQVWEDDDTDEAAAGSATAGTYRTINLKDSNVESDGEVLATGQGFFVQNSTADPAERLTIRLDAQTTRPSTVQFFGKHGRDEAVLPLHLTGAGVRDLSTRLFFHPDATPNWDRYDTSKLQPLGHRFAALASSTRHGLQAQDARPFDFTKAQTFDLVVTTAGYDGMLTLTWPELNALPGNWHLRLYDRVTATEIDLRSTGVYTFTPKDVAGKVLNAADEHGALMRLQHPATPRFILTVAPPVATTTERLNVPGDVTLEAAYPNPFSGATTLRYTIPQPSDVRLAVYDLMGREVALLADGPRTAGWHTATWYAGHSASGVYVIRLETPSRLTTQRVILLQ